MLEAGAHSTTRLKCVVESVRPRPLNKPHTIQQNTFTSVNFTWNQCVVRSFIESVQTADYYTGRCWQGDAALLSLRPFGRRFLVRDLEQQEFPVGASGRYSKRHLLENVGIKMTDFCDRFIAWMYILWSSSTMLLAKCTGDARRQV